MRVRVATTVVGLTAVLLALPACSTDTTGGHQPSAARAREPSDRA